MRGLYKAEEIAFNLSLAQVVKALGYQINKPLPAPEVLSRIEALLQQAKQFIKPAAIYSTKTFRLQDERIFYLDRNNFSAPKVGSVLASCSEVIIFLVTIGIDLEARVSEFIKRGDAFASIVFDSVGSVAAELTADWLQEKIERKLNPNEFCLTHRYSPGYCDWELQEQQKLLSLLEPELIGVELTESLMMKPRKSISGVFGILAKGSLAKAKNPCSLCAQKNCAHRRFVAKPIYEKIKNL
jgi:cobalamin-dependent methionine synthase I